MRRVKVPPVSSMHTPEPLTTLERFRWLCVRSWLRVRRRALRRQVRGLVRDAPSLAVAARPFKAYAGRRFSDGTFVDPSRVNCYGHALDVPRGLDPGIFARRRADSPKTVLRLLDSLGAFKPRGWLVRLDGLRPVRVTRGGRVRVVPGAWPVVMFVSARDFHFVRLDRQGTWSHKQGESREALIPVGAPAALFAVPRPDPADPEYRLAGAFWAANPSSAGRGGR